MTIQLPRMPVTKRRRRIEAPAQLELTLPLPREVEPRVKPEEDADEPQSERGVAHVDFYI